MTKRRLIGMVVGLLATLAVLLGMNALVVDDQTKSAHADIGRIVALAHGVSLQVRDEGPRTAPTIVLLHGFAGSLHWWDSVAPELAGRSGIGGYRVIRFDLLGHGGSEKPSGGYTMEHQAQLVDEALAQLGIRRALIVGHSMGGTVAAALSARDRPLVAGLVLIDSPVNSHTGQLPFIARLGFVPLIGQATRTLATNDMVQQGLKAAFAPGFKVPHQFVSDFWRMTYSSYASSSSESRAYLQREPIDKRLARLGVPLLALYGTRDKLVSPGSQREYANVPGALVVAIAGAGHSPMVEKPAETLRLILAFASHTLH